MTGKSTPPAAEPDAAAPADPATVAPVESEPTTPPAAAGDPPKEPVQDAEFWKGKASAMEREKKTAEKELARLKAAEQERLDAEKTELQKAQEAQAKAEAKAKALELKDLQRAAADKVGLPVALANRLQGATAEELEADAQILKENLPAQAGAAQAAQQAPSGSKKTNPPQSSQKTDQAWHNFLYNDGPLPQ